jgi:cell division protein FtsN
MTSRNDRQPPAATRRRPAPSRKSGAGGTLFGIFVGVALGLCLAASVAFYVLKAGNPYAVSGQAREASREVAKDSPKSGRGETATPEKPRFDFYKILPGVEEPRVQSKAAERTVSPDKTLAKVDERAAQAEKTAKAAERFWLQAGSFANEADAENLKARLALAGWEAAIQSATLPDKGLRFRVRLGPYDNTDELSRMKNELAKRGFDVAVIK